MSHEHPLAQNTETVVPGSEPTEDLGSRDFLLREYDRLVAYNQLTVEGYHRLFNIYLAVAAASVTVFVPLATYFPQNEPTIVNTVLAGLFGLGLIVFVGLSYDNAMIVHLEAAMQLIQTYFTDRELDIGLYLYFHRRSPRAIGFGIPALAVRGLSSGSPKSLLVIANSIVAAAFVTKIALESGILPFILVLQSVTAIAVFAISISLHLAIGYLVYKMHDLTPAEDSSG